VSRTRIFLIFQDESTYHPHKLLLHRIWHRSYIFNHPRLYQLDVRSATNVQRVEAARCAKIMMIRDNKRQKRSYQFFNQRRCWNLHHLCITPIHYWSAPTSCKQQGSWNKSLSTTTLEVKSTSKFTRPERYNRSRAETSVTGVPQLSTSVICPTTFNQCSVTIKHNISFHGLLCGRGIQSAPLLELCLMLPKQLYLVTASTTSLQKDETISTSYKDTDWFDNRCIMFQSTQISEICTHIQVGWRWLVLSTLHIATRSRHFRIPEVKVVKTLIYGVKSSKGGFRLEGISFSPTQLTQWWWWDVHVAGLKWFPRQTKINIGKLNFSKKRRGKKPVNTSDVIPFKLT